MTQIQKIKIFCPLLIFILITNINAQQNLSQEAYTIFEQSCLICHGENGSYRESLIIEHTALIEGGTVVPNDPEASEFYKRLLGDTENGPQMPLGQPPLAPEAIETIRQWIAAGAPDWNVTPRPKPGFITTDTMLETIENHVNSLSARDKSFARYFTLTHLYNAGETTEALNAYRRALSKLINSLSWGRKVVKPQPIDAEQTLFYIDLRDYEWDIRNEAWTQIEQAYPYKMTFDAPTQTHLREKLTTLQQNMNCGVPFVHVDWFLATASLPPLYNHILDLPETDRELETILNVSVLENLQNAPGKRVWRAGFNDSGVSRHNRVVERHISQHGAYWKSYDFAGSADSQNIFTHPLDFTHDGGEIIFNLPNGLQAYFLVDGVGTRLDEAPISIVSDPAASDPTVRNGLSCIGCHTEGMKTFEDEVRAVVEQVDNPPYNKDLALELYVEKSVMDGLVAEDTQRYREVLEAAGGVFGGIEPIQRFHEVFQGPLDAAQAAASVGLETEAFLEKISKSSTLQNLLGVLVIEGGTVKRDAWTSNFETVIAEINSPDSDLPPDVERPEIIPGAGVHIPDPNLRTAIEEALGKMPGSEITQDDMTRLGSFLANKMDIKDLTGLETAIRLEHFSAWGNPISDITPLAGLQKLHSLDISNTHVSDLKPLVNLTKLKILLLNGNGISDVSPLVGLVSLTHLNLKENNISDISPLAELRRLKRLELQSNLIKNVSRLAKLIQLEWLGLQHNLISDFSPLETLFATTSIVSHDNPGFSGGPKIEGPWLWVTVPGELDNEDRARLSDRDLLATASNNQVTEQEVATNGVAEGEIVGDSTWTVGELNAGDEDNINTMLRQRGINPSQFPDYVVYGSTTLYSPLEQNTKMFVGSDTSTKVWLNGTLIRKNNGHYHTEGYQTFFPITLKAGKNVLLVAIDNRSGGNWSGYFGFAEGTEYKVSPSLNVHIPDVNLRAAIARMLEKSIDEPITIKEMESFKHLDIGSELNSSKKIKDLTGLEYAINLEVLWFFNNEISDLSPLAGLTKMIQMSMEHNPITSFSALTNMEELQGIQISHNNIINDITPLAGKTKLRSVLIWGCPITDISSLTDLPSIEYIDLCGNQISEIPSFENAPKLKKLYIYNNKVSDVSVLQNHTNLERLNLRDNNITDISPLAALTNLKWLDLRNNPITNFSPLAALAQNTNIIAGNVNIPDRNLRAAIADALGKDNTGVIPITLEEMATLTILRASSRDIKDLTGLEYAINLEELGLSDNQITDFSPLAELSNLIRLALVRNQIVDISPLKNLQNLKWLDLARNSIEDLSPINELISLEDLSLWSNDISDISALKDMRNLLELDLSGNRVIDVTLLNSLHSLKFLYLGDNTTANGKQTAGSSKALLPRPRTRLACSRCH